jgi:hypothetical protein
MVDEGSPQIALDGRPRLTANLIYFIVAVEEPLRVKYCAKCDGYLYIFSEARLKLKLN